MLDRPSASLPWRLVESSQQLAAVTVAGIWSKLSKQPAGLRVPVSVLLIDNRYPELNRFIVTRDQLHNCFTGVSCLSSS